VFWVAVVVYGLSIGVSAVTRAEIPRKILVPELRYDSPMQIGGAKDTQAEYGSSEFREFRALGWGTVVKDLDPYADYRHVRAYPPFFGIAFFPFSVFWRWPGVGSGLFFLVGYLGGLLAAWVLAVWWQPQGQKVKFGLFALNWILLAPFIGSVLARCETDMLVITPVAVALMFFAQGRRRFTAGALLGFAASFKVLPALFGVYLLCQRRWRCLSGMVAGGLVCTVLMSAVVWGPSGAFEKHMSWYRHIIAPYRTEGARGFIGRPYRSTNQSLTAAIHRFLTPIRAGKDDDTRMVNVLNLSPEQADRIASVLCGAVGLGLVALWVICRRKEETAAVRAAAFATVPLGILLLSGVSLTTHHVNLVVPCGVIIACAVGLRDEAGQRWLWAALAAMGLCFLGASRTILLLSPFLAGTVLLLVAVGVIVIQDRLGASAAASGSDGALQQTSALP